MLGISAFGLAPPKIAPRSSFCSIVNRNRFKVTSMSAMPPMPTTTTRPPFLVRVMAGSMSSPLIRPTVMMVLSAILPQVISITGAMASAIDGKVWVAPNFLACSRWNSEGSMTMTRSAPETAAPCTEFIPTPPAPTTTTVSPALTSATLVAEPQPVVTPQPTRQATSNGISLSILTTEDWWTVTYGEKVPSRHIGMTFSPSAVWMRNEPSEIDSPVIRYMPRSHRFDCPVTHGSHLPQEGMNDSTTWSPTSTSSTPSPTWMTLPAPSWPPMAG